MKWIVIFLLLSACGRSPHHTIVDYAPFTKEEVKCITKNVKPVDKSLREKEEYILEFDGKYYRITDPKFEACLKDL